MGRSGAVCPARTLRQCGRHRYLPHAGSAGLRRRHPHEPPGRTRRQLGVPLHRTAVAISGHRPLCPHGMALRPTAGRCSDGNGGDDKHPSRDGKSGDRPGGGNGGKRLTACREPFLHGVFSVRFAALSAPEGVKRLFFHCVIFLRSSGSPHPAFLEAGRFFVGIIRGFLPFEVILAYAYRIIFVQNKRTEKLGTLPHSDFFRVGAVLP